MSRYSTRIGMNPLSDWPVGEVRVIDGHQVRLTARSFSIATEADIEIGVEVGDHVATLTFEEVNVAGFDGNSVTATGKVP